jgi:hypothetical protein
MTNYVRASQNIMRFVERTERIMDREQDENKRERYRQIMRETLEKMERRKAHHELWQRIGTEETA